MKLRPWQVEPANRLREILRHGNAVDLSDTGTGKTYVACAVSAMLGVNTLAVVPKIARSAWLTVADYLGAPVEAVGYEALRTGRTNFGRWECQPPVPFKADESLVCESCQCVVDFDDYRPCYCHPNGTHCIKIKKKPWQYGRFIWNDIVKLIIFDEIHRCSGLDSLNADMLIAAKRQGVRILGLSATAACTPLQMRALGFALDLHGLNQNIPVMTTGKLLVDDILSRGFRFRQSETLPTFYQWSGRYDCRPDPVHRGLKWFAGAERQKTIMADIHSKILPARGVRVRTSEIPGFPERLITAELYDLEKDYEIQKLYREMASALDALAERAAQDVDTDSPLTQVLRARQRISLLKVPIFQELAEDELAKGNSVAIFVNFTATLTELRLRLRCDAIVDGSAEGVRGREDSIRSFQSNENRLILLNSGAGGVAIGLQDLHGGHPRVALVEPTYSAVQMLQIFGRLPRDGGKSLSRYRIILAANTVETRIQKAFESKQHCIEALNDSDLDPLTSAGG